MPQPSFHQEVDERAQRKLRAQARKLHTVWQGLGVMGLVGWSVALPAVLGALFGAWLDRTHPTGRSWTLTFLVAGLMLGCWNAWRWVAKEEAAIRAEADGGDTRD
jgi:ATP synthase protein I